MDQPKDTRTLAEWILETGDVSQYLWDRGWAETNAGNLSVDVTGLAGQTGVRCAAFQETEHAYPELAGRRFLVTATGRRFRDCARDAAGSLCTVKVADDGRGYEVQCADGANAALRPTSEFPSHLMVHRFLRANGNPCPVVLHTHPTELIALTHVRDYADEASLNRALFAIHPEVKVNVPKGIGLVPYTLPGSEALAEETVRTFERGHTVVLWTYHGAVAIGINAHQAFDRIDTLNKAAKLLLLVRSAGETPGGLTGAQLDELTEAFHLED